ncbi:MAG: hypothetical protein JRD89_02695, partial [Deltaproteobacteria bacterium]|nr:hypothetical protein [Deltaproteobacteria bacterium]
EEIKEKKPEEEEEEEEQQVSEETGGQGEPTDGEAQQTTNASPQTFEEWLETIPDPILRDEMRANRQQIIERRERLITSLVQNERCAFTKDELSEMTTSALEKLNRSLSPENYAGVGGPRRNASENDSRIPAPPPVILAKNE